METELAETFRINQRPQKSYVLLPVRNPAELNLKLIRRGLRCYGYRVRSSAIGSLKKLK